MQDLRRRFHLPQACPKRPQLPLVVRSNVPNRGHSSADLDGEARVYDSTLRKSLWRISASRSDHGGPAPRMTVMCGVCYVCGLVANAGSLWLGTAWPGVDPRRPMDAYDSEARPP